MRKFILLLSASAALTVAAPAAFAQIHVDTPVGGVRIGEPRHHYRHYRDYDDRVVERRVYRDRAVRLGGDCRTVTIERDDGSMRRIRRCD